MAHKTPFKCCSMKIETLTRFFIFFLFKPNNLVSCLKAWVDVSLVGAYLWGFFQLQKREINDKGGICVKCDVTLVVIRDEA